MRQATERNTRMRRKQKSVTLAALVLACGLVSPLTCDAGAAAELTVLGTMDEESCNIQVNELSSGTVTFSTYMPDEFKNGGGTADIQTLTIQTENCSLPGAGGKASIIVRAGAGTAVLAGGTVFTNDSGDQSAGFMLRELGTNATVPNWSRPKADFYDISAPDTMKDGIPGPEHDTDDQKGLGNPGDLTSGTSLEYAVGFVSTNGTTVDPNPGSKYKVNLIFSFLYH